MQCLNNLAHVALPGMTWQRLAAPDMDWHQLAQTLSKVSWHRSTQKDKPGRDLHQLAKTGTDWQMVLNLNLSSYKSPLAAGANPHEAEKPPLNTPVL